jgi:hypothetical protein
MKNYLKSLLENLKKLNKERVVNRRNIKFKTTLSNSFDRKVLEISSLNSLITINSASAKISIKELAVYSTYFGSNKNKTFNARTVAAGVDHYFISNNKDILSTVESAGWIPIFLDMEISINRVLSAQQAKIPKALPHIFPKLSNYDFLFYVDDKIEFEVSALKSLLEMMRKNEKSIIVRAHPSLHGNILNEFAAAMIQPRYQAQRDQTVDYIDAKLHDGLKLKVENLYWTSAILRNMRHPDTIKINEDWYANILECGIECQISFDFIAQKYSSISVMPDIINGVTIN